MPRHLREDSVAGKHPLHTTREVLARPRLGAGARFKESQGNSRFNALYQVLGGFPLTGRKSVLQCPWRRLNPRASNHPPPIPCRPTGRSRMCPGRTASPGRPYVRTRSIARHRAHVPVREQSHYPAPGGPSTFGPPAIVRKRSQCQAPACGRTDPRLACHGPKCANEANFVTSHNALLHSHAVESVVPIAPSRKDVPAMLMHLGAMLLMKAR
jgi:hypothetical protein